MIFYTRSCSHLADSIILPRGNVTVGQFKDGELTIKVHDDVQDKPVWVCASTVAPAENILETLFLIDALIRAGAVVKILFVYFGYARQDKIFSGEPLSVQVICRTLEQFALKEIHVIHIHNPEVCAYLPLHNHIPFDFFGHYVHDVDLIVAPDQGATVFAKLIAARHKKEYTLVKKRRSDKEKVETVELEIDVSGKKILIVDDIISTADTIIKVSEALDACGAKKILVAATHGLFSSGAHEKIEESNIEKVFVTNTLLQSPKNSKIITADISFFLGTIMNK